MQLKKIGLQLCTCTWIEIMTCIGIALYLLYNSEYYLVLITTLVFSPLIGFHFAVSRTNKEEYCTSCRKSYWT